MEDKNLEVNSKEFTIPVLELTDVVNKYMQREHGSDDVDFLEQKGGDQWLERGLLTDLKNGIQMENLN